MLSKDFASDTLDLLQAELDKIEAECSAVQVGGRF
jgi:hypothetical protein